MEGLLSRLILCAVFLVLNGKESYGAVNLDFLKDPNFPGNSAWTEKLNHQIQQTVDNAMKGSATTGPYNGNYPGSNVAYTPPTMPQILIPHAPQNFPFPPDCEAVPDPGYTFPDMSDCNNNVMINNVKQEMVTRHRSFLCRDPEYGPDSFYMQMTEKGPANANGSKSRNVYYYDTNGRSINYSRKMVMLPIGESLPQTPRNDYLGDDIKFY